MDRCTEPKGLFEQAQPFLQLAGMIAGIVVWCVSTFSLKEQTNKIESMVISQRKEILDECFSYSDNNRERTNDKFSPAVQDIKDQLTWLKGKIK